MDRHHTSSKGWWVTLPVYYLFTFIYSLPVSQGLKANYKYDRTIQSLSKQITKYNNICMTFESNSRFPQFYKASQYMIM